MSFLHGVEVIELDGGARPIKGVSSSIIGLVGTAISGPVNQPVLIAGSRKKAVEMFGLPDGVSTIPDALDGIFDQTGAIVVVVNVLDPTLNFTQVEATEYTFSAKDEIIIPDSGASNLVVTSTDANTTYQLDTDYSFDVSTKKLTLIAEGNIS